MRQKRLPMTDADVEDEEEEPSKRPRTRFVALQPAANDPGMLTPGERISVPAA